MAKTNREVLLVPLRELLPHEDVDMARVLGLAASVKSSGRLLKPVIAEEKTLVIIDGHHRYHALKLLGARLVPVVLASYTRDIVSIASRPRVIRTCEAITKAIDMVAGAIEEASRRDSSTIIIHANGLRVRLHRNPLEANYAVKELLGAIPLARYNCTRRTPYSISVNIPPLKPKAIIRAGFENTVPRKTTIHNTLLKKLYAPVRFSRLV